MRLINNGIRDLRLRAASVALLCAILLVVDLGFRPQRARADFGATFAALKEAYGLYGTLSDILIPNEQPDLVNLITQSKVEIITELRKIRNDALVNDVNFLVDGFADVLRMSNPSGELSRHMLAELRVKMWQVKNHIDPIATNYGDRTSAYSVAPARVLLTAVGMGIMFVNGRVFIGEPTTWAQFHSWLQPAMSVFNTLVNNTYHECSTGFNPGFAPQPGPNEHPWAWMARMKPGAPRASLLWGHLATTQIHVQIYLTPRSNRFPCPSSSDNAVIYMTCSGWGTCVERQIGCHFRYPTFNACPGIASGRECAAQLATPGYNNDRVVRLVRESMSLVQTLSGGTEGGAQNDLFLFHGKFVDPWVAAGDCAPISSVATNTRRAYPHIP